MDFPSFSKYLSAAGSPSRGQHRGRKKRRSANLGPRAREGTRDSGNSEKRRGVGVSTAGPGAGGAPREGRPSIHTRGQYGRQGNDALAGGARRAEGERDGQEEAERPVLRRPDAPQAPPLFPQPWLLLPPPFQGRNSGPRERSA